ncbi:Crp/Fnr family transcriptional regulator [Hephaestia sp. GCM10023244]|uniref:Crp/Fnr family transcriptional regulator n=1 Tax=unclassified Hephaestia TaxID=2631281 RepID=UPI002076FEA2|nr:Crp/Fnr family transcriptional regulator [Hephaestia sp. MAHUQ-44]MCM8730361.1 Crp/Fnr family transcriptional regulator [Hephaestia sp. MAHUQ-44]
MSLHDPDHAAAIAALDLFDGLPATALAEVCARAHIRALAHGARTFDQGEPVERAHVLLSGAVRIAQAGSDGGEVVLRFIGPGEIFGSVAIFTDRRYPADGIAMTESVEVSWDHAVWHGLIERHPRIALNLIGIVGHRLAELQDRVREMATQRTDRRIANTLLRLARQAGRPTRNGTEIGFPLRRKDIADIAGTTLYTVSRTLNAWERDGLIAGRRRLTLISMAGIEQIAAG